MTTIVNNYSRTVVFQDTNENFIEVCQFKDGFAYVDITSRIMVDAKGIKSIKIVNRECIVRFISGCFEEGSNFKEKLFEAFNVDESMEFIGFILGDKEKISKENSDVWGIEEALHCLVNSYEAELRKETEKMLKEYTQKRDEIFKAANRVAFEAKDGYTAEDIQNELESLKEDNGQVQFAIIFALYTRYVMEEENLEIHRAADKTYEEIVEYVYPKVSPEDLENIINWLEKYWKYGKEIKEWYIDKMVKDLNGFADML